MLEWKYANRAGAASNAGRPGMGGGGGRGMRLLMKMEGVVGIAFSIHSLIMDGSSNKNKNDKRREKEDEVWKNAKKVVSRNGMIQLPSNKRS